MKRKEFEYNLPTQNIATKPKEPRHHSKLLHFKNGMIEDRTFYQLPQLLPEGCQLIINNAKVIPARIFCQKPTGAKVEVFLLEPLGDYLESFSKTQMVQWKVLVGNKKRWKDGSVQDIANLCTISWLDRAENTVRIHWQSKEIFAELLEKIGKIPIPPYLNRETEESDSKDYQTYYSKTEGSVAAPTAGLHFTKSVLDDLSKKNIRLIEATLHVGAGTFKPVEADQITEHIMHGEHFELTIDLVEGLLSHQGVKIAVGTTSLRILESLYQIGINLHNGISNPTHILQSHTHENELQYTESLSLVRAFLKKNGNQTAQTSIFIYPGKRIKSVDGIITNFHQSSSSLLILIEACIGKDWKKIYTHALENDYRFLSYGDSSLLWLPKSKISNSQ